MATTTAPELAAGTGSWVAWNEASPTVDIPEAETAGLVARIFQGSGVRTIDTSNNYGHGETERRIGRAIQALGGVPDGIVIQTKADRDMRSGEFSGARVRRSIDESRDRLGLDVLPLVYLHDPENISWADATAVDGPMAALVEARAAGTVRRIGVAGGPAALMRRFLETGHFDALITHNRFTLVDRSADALLDLAHSLGVDTANASPYGGGFLTAWPPPTDRYAYDVADPRVVQAAGVAALLCAEAGVPLAAAALRFSTDDPRIDRTIIGMRTTVDLEATEALLAVKLPGGLLDALRALPLDRAAWSGGWQDGPAER